MKSLWLTIVFSCIYIQLFAQMNISTNLRQDGYWDEEKEEWIIVSEDEDELTFFEFNKDFTMFKHTTPGITSAYIIKSQTKDEERNQFELTVVSDVGNKYMMILDVTNNNLRFLYEKKGTMWMVRHSIKRTWFDDDDDE